MRVIHSIIGGPLSVFSRHSDTGPGESSPPRRPRHWRRHFTSSVPRDGDDDYGASVLWLRARFLRKNSVHASFRPCETARRTTADTGQEQNNCRATEPTAVCWWPKLPRSRACGTRTRWTARCQSLRRISDFSTSWLRPFVVVRARIRHDKPAVEVRYARICHRIGTPRISWFYVRRVKIIAHIV